MTCPLVQAVALTLTLIQHSAPVKGHPEVVLLAVRQVLLVALSNHPASVDDHLEVVLLPVALKI